MVYMNNILRIDDCLCLFLLFVQISQYINIPSRIKNRNKSSHYDNKIQYINTVYLFSTRCRRSKYTKANTIYDE
jgi:hypothetical protein